jgi:hypothetical protein
MQNPNIPNKLRAESGIKTDVKTESQSVVNEKD